MDHWKRNIILFLSSQTISLFGSSLVQYAITWYITLNTQSGMMMTISIICGFVPAFFLSPFAGVWADRYNRKLLIILADASIAISTLLLAIVFLIGYDEIWLLFVISAIRALGTGIQTPAVGAALPQLVPADQLTRINGFNGSIQSLIMLISPMISGAIFATVSIESIFFIDVITAAIGISILFVFVPIHSHAKAAQKQQSSYFTDLKEGYLYIKQHDFIKKFFSFFAIFFVLAAPVAFLTPLQVTRNFGNNVWYLTAIEVAFALGMLIGGIIIAIWGGFKNKIHTMMMASVLTGLCTFLLGIIPNFWIYLTITSICGVVMPLFNTPSMVLLQEKVEENFLGRVFSILTMISTSMMPLGMLVFGPLADYIAIEWMLIGTGFMMMLLGFFLVRSKVLVEAGKPTVEVTQD
ncbi:MFS transporter [Rummeliibacillus sp. JY-2-4R]